MGVLDWLNDLIRFIGTLFPRWFVIQATHGGVKYTRGRKPQRLHPGFHWYWPVITDVEMVSRRWRPTRLHRQTLTTQDGKAVIVGGFIEWRVIDWYVFLVDIEDGDESAVDAAATAIRNVVQDKTLADVLSMVRNVTDNALRREVDKVMASYGTKVRVVKLTDLAEARVVNLVHTRDLQDQSSNSSSGGVLLA